MGNPTSATVLLLPIALTLMGCEEKRAPSDPQPVATAHPSADAADVIDRTRNASAAKEAVGEIIRAALAAAAKEDPSGDTLAIDGEGEGPSLPKSAEPVPKDATAVAGKAYESTEADWTSWKALGYRSDGPQRCQLLWTVTDAEGTAEARCDFDGDGKLDYHIARKVRIVGDEAKPGIVEEIIPLARE